MKFHDELNQALFDGMELKPEVKDKLKEIADAFIEYLEIDRDAIKDVVITGSSVSYNYTKYSDIDLHLKVDYDLVHEDCPIVEGYLWACKTNFNKEHDISIYGVPVELYAESIEEDTVHNGLYSLWQDKWIDKPNKIPPTDNDGAVLSKYNEIKNAADRIQDSEVASELIDKIYQMRKSGLQQAGEFSTENLAFKKLRDEGVLERLREMKKQKIDKELSLESYNESYHASIQNRPSIQKIQDALNAYKPVFEIKKGYAPNLYKFSCSEKDWKEVYKILKEFNCEKLNWNPSLYPGHKGVFKFIYPHDIEEQIDKQLSLESYNQPIVNESWNTYSVQYQVIDRNDRISTKTKEFKTEKALQNWIAKQEDNPNFYGILATSYPDEIKLKENNEDDEDIPEEMHKERYVTYFETQEGRQKYTIYHVYTDSTDDSYNELCDKRDNQLGMYSSYKKLKDALKERAEKIAKKQGWIVKSIENLGEDDEYYKERNKWESIKEEVTVDSYLKMLRDGGHLFDKEDAEYLIQCFNDKKLEVLAEYKDVEKAAQRFLACCNKYDKVVFKQLCDNGKEIKVIDTDTKELNKKPLFMQNEDEKQFTNTINFNSPEEFKQDLEKARKEYKVVDQMEGKDLLHLVYKNELKYCTPILRKYGYTNLLLEDCDNCYVIEFNYEDNYNQGIARGQIKVKANSEEEALQKAEDSIRRNPTYAGKGVNNFRIVPKEYAYSNTDIIESLIETMDKALEEKSIKRAVKFFNWGNVKTAKEILIRDCDCTEKQAEEILVQWNNDAVAQAGANRMKEELNREYFVGNNNGEMVEEAGVFNTWDEASAWIDNYCLENNITDYMDCPLMVVEGDPMEELEEDCATLEKKLDDVQSDLDDMIKAYSYNEIDEELVLQNLKKSIQEALA